MAAMAVATKAERTTPRMLGRYRLGDRIGAGGTSEVYRAELEGASGFAKPLVVKCLRPALADEPELVEGLAREARLAQRLHHGNIVQVLDFGVEDGRPYAVMEHVDGCSLHELAHDLRRRGERMGLGEALYVVEEVAAALRYAHGLTDDRGVPLRLVHRDVKPGNVLVSREGVVKLADFGIAKLAGDHGDTLPGVVKGTPQWLAPEQALGRGVDARTDVFALGLLLRALVDDDAPAPPPDPRVDQALRDVWLRASADAPADRWDDVQAMLGALQRWRAAHALDAGPGQLPAWVRRARQQAPLAIPVALDAALLGAGERDVTMTSAAEAGACLSTQPPARRDRTRVLLTGTLALGGAALVLWASAGRLPASSAGEATPQPPAPARATLPEPTEPTEPTEPARVAPEPATPEPARVAPEPAAPEPAAPEPSLAASARRRPLPRAAEPGRLRVNVLPWAEVTVDGRAHGRVPVDMELAAGRHRVRLDNPQLGARTYEIEVPAGGVHTITKW